MRNFLASRGRGLLAKQRSKVYNKQLQINLPKCIKWSHYISFACAIYSSCLRCFDVQCTVYNNAYKCVHGIVGGFEFTVLQRNLKELARKAMEMCLRVLKESNKSRFDSYSRQEQCIDHIPYYLSELSRAHFSDNLSRNSCIWDSATPGLSRIGKIRTDVHPQNIYIYIYIFLMFYDIF